MDARDAVADRDDGPGFGDVDGALVIFNLFAENSRYLVCSNLSHIPVNSCQSAFNGQPTARADVFQLRADRTVINGRTNPGDHTADQLRIDREVAPDLFARNSRQLLLQIRLLAVVQRRRRLHIRPYNSKPFIERSLKRVSDVVEAA